jgi:hypothetical protein
MKWLTSVLPSGTPMVKVPFMPGMVFVFLDSKVPTRKNPPRSLSLLILTVVGIFISGEPGPIAPAGMVLSHFQLPSMLFISASHSGETLGIAIAAPPSAGAAPSFLA